jgi:protein glucosyltransferase
MKTFFYLLTLLLSLSGFANHWIQQQVAEDLADVPLASFTSQEVLHLFEEMSEQGQQVQLYTIKNNRLSSRSSTRSDNWRNPHLDRYLLRLTQQHRLPDMKFIIRTDDGVATPFRLPIFAFAKFREAKNVCHFPDFEMLWELADRERNWIPSCQQRSQQHPWETKKAIGFFRGMSTGKWNPSLPDFGNDRVRLTIFSYHHPSLVDATVSQLWQSDLREYITTIGKEISGASIDTHFEYKYIFDVDGNASSYSRGRWILLSNSVLLKVMSDCSQWYHKALEPYVHFVPVKSDLSDLQDILEFLKSNDEKARQIATQGVTLGTQIFSYEMTDQYVLSLLYEYTKRMRH